MATIFKHLDTHEKDIFLSAGFGAYKSSRPSFFLGSLAPVEDLI